LGHKARPIAAQLLNDFWFDITRGKFCDIVDGAVEYFEADRLQRLKGPDGLKLLTNDAGIKGQPVT
jgi:hypothetical protein